MNTVLQLLNIEQAAMPGILMLLSIIKAHHNATGQIPSEQQILAAIPVDQQTLKTMWDGWTAAHPQT